VRPRPASRGGRAEAGRVRNINCRAIKKWKTLSENSLTKIGQISINAVFLHFEVSSTKRPWRAERKQQRRLSVLETLSTKLIVIKNEKKFLHPIHACPPQPLDSP